MVLPPAPCLHQLVGDSVEAHGLRTRRLFTANIAIPQRNNVNNSGFAGHLFEASQGPRHAGSSEIRPHVSWPLVNNGSTLSSAQVRRPFHAATVNVFLFHLRNFHKRPLLYSYTFKTVFQSAREQAQSPGNMQQRILQFLLQILHSRHVHTGTSTCYCTCAEARPLAHCYVVFAITTDTAVGNRHIDVVGNRITSGPKTESRVQQRGV